LLVDRETLAQSCQQKLTSAVATSTVIMIMNGAFSGGGNLCLTELRTENQESWPSLHWDVAQSFWVFAAEKFYIFAN